MDKRVTIPDNNGGRPSEAEKFEKGNFGHPQDDSRSPPQMIKLSSGINFQMGNQQKSKNEMSENLVDPKEKQFAGTKGDGNY